MNSNILLKNNCQYNFNRFLVINKNMVGIPLVDIQKIDLSPRLKGLLILILGLADSKGYVDSFSVMKKLDKNHPLSFFRYRMNRKWRESFSTLEKLKLISVDTPHDDRIQSIKVNLDHLDLKNSKVTMLPRNVFEEKAIDLRSLYMLAMTILKEDQSTLNSHRIMARKTHLDRRTVKKYVNQSHYFLVESKKFLFEGKELLLSIAHSIKVKLAYQGVAISRVKHYASFMDKVFKRKINDPIPTRHRIELAIQRLKKINTEKCTNNIKLNNLINNNGLTKLEGLKKLSFNDLCKVLLSSGKGIRLREMENISEFQLRYVEKSIAGRLKSIFGASYLKPINLGVELKKWAQNSSDRSFQSCHHFIRAAARYFEPFYVKKPKFVKEVPMEVRQKNESERNQVRISDIIKKLRINL